MTAVPTSFDRDQLSTRSERDEAIARLLIGESDAIRRLRLTIAQIAPAQLPILIVGPTGAGKELVARAVHAASMQSGDLVAFNVCAVSESMFEATLFGHVKGAFTGAVTDTAGYLAEANGGTLFLDEISGLPLGAQAKLLRAIETGVYRPVGAGRDRLSRFRVVAATNEDLAPRVVNGGFREDLYHRLGGFVLRVPPLRERATDVRILIDHFLAMRGDLTLRVSESSMALLEEYAWPGNIRELRHVLERMALLAGTDRTITQGVARAAIDSGRELHMRKVDDLDREVARSALFKALEESGWNADRAAELLGVHRATIYRRMQREGLTSTSERRPLACLSVTWSGQTSHESTSAKAPGAIISNADAIDGRRCWARDENEGQSQLSRDLSHEWRDGTRLSKR